MNQVLRIDGELPPDLNKFRNMHYQKKNKLKVMWSQRIAALVEEQGIQPMTKIHMRYEFWFKTRGERDPDNFIACAKFINDGLVDCGVLLRDNFNVIVSLTVNQGGISKRPYLLIHMTEAIN
jgi:hypothetical protein